MLPGRLLGISWAPLKPLEFLVFPMPGPDVEQCATEAPGGQPENLMVIGKSAKTVGCSDILRSRAAWNKMEYSGRTFPLVRLWFELRTMHTGILQKLLEDIFFDGAK